MPPSPDRPPGWAPEALPRLRSMFGGLPTAEQRVAVALLADPERSVGESIAELSARAGGSPATIVRLARRAGFDGFPQLKLALARELGSAGAHAGSAPTAVAAETATATSVPFAPWSASLADDVRAISTVPHVLDVDALDAAAAAILAADETFVCGIGSSAGFAALVALRFSVIGIRAASAGEPRTQQLHASALRPSDVCVGISHTGESRETIDALVSAGRAGATTVAVTSFAGSPVTAVADLVLVCSDRSAPAVGDQLFENPVALLSVLGALHAEVAARR